MPAEGPWTSRHCGNSRYKVSRCDSRIDYVGLQAHEAQVKVAELNAAERVRDAAPALLAACEAAVEAMNSLDGSIYEENDLISESGKQLEAAIKAAKGTG